MIRQRIHRVVSIANKRIYAGRYIVRGVGGIVQAVLRAGAVEKSAADAGRRCGDKEVI